jgi:hypothetical protein
VLHQLQPPLTLCPAGCDAARLLPWRRNSAGLQPNRPSHLSNLGPFELFLWLASLSIGSMHPCANCEWERLEGALLILRVDSAPAGCLSLDASGHECSSQPICCAKHLGSTTFHQGRSLCVGGFRCRPNSLPVNEGSCRLLYRSCAVTLRGS